MRRHRTLFVLAGTVTLLATGVLVHSTRTLTASVEREALLLQRQRASELASHLDAQLLLSGQIATSTATLAAPMRDRAQVEGFIQQMLRSTSPEAVYGIGVWFEPHVFETSTRLYGPYAHRTAKQGEVVLTFEWATAEYDFPNQPWYRLGISTGAQPAFTEPYFDVDHVYMTTTRSMYDPSGRVIGVVSVDLILPQLIETIARINIRPSEAFYVTTPGGNLFAHPDEQRLLTWARANGRNPKTILDLGLDDLAQFELTEDRTRVRQDVPVSRSGWKVHVASDQKTLFGASTRIRWTAAMLVALLWWAGLVGVVANLRRRHAADLAREVEAHDHAEKALRESVHQRDEFLSLAAHELRTPLTPLTARLVMLQRQLRANKPIDVTHVDRALAAAHRLAKLIDDLLDVSRAQSAHLVMDPEKTSMRNIVEKAMTVSSPTPDRKLEVALPDDDVMVYGDPSRLEQVVSNLLTNAIKYSPSGGTIWVSLTSIGCDAVLSVQDEGIGIPMEEQGHVFERYFRASNAPSRTFSGLGIGLFVCKDIVAAHGGRIWVESTGLRGSTFKVAIPLLEDVSVRTLRIAESAVAQPRRSSHG